MVNNLIEEAWNCTLCEKAKLPFVPSSDAGRAFRFPPTIGATRQAALLFVGINPRVSDSNRYLHDALIRDFGAFTELASNRHRGQTYIGQGGLEKHYSVHARIASELFPGKPFEAVAAVTELFFCASESSRGIPVGQSACADRYFERVLASVQPQVVFAVGSAVNSYMLRRYGSEDGHTFATWIGTNRAPVISIPHPNSWGEKTSKRDKAVETARAWMSDNGSQKASAVTSAN